VRTEGLTAALILLGLSMGVWPALVEIWSKSTQSIQVAF
jgi:hypothetical protein